MVGPARNICRHCPVDLPVDLQVEAGAGACSDVSGVCRKHCYLKGGESEHAYRDRQITLLHDLQLRYSCKDTSSLLLHGCFPMTTTLGRNELFSTMETMRYNTKIPSSSQPP